MNHGYASPPGLLRAHPELKARVRSFVLEAIRGRMASPSASVSLEHPQIVTNLQSEVFTTVPGLRSGDCREYVFESCIPSPWTLFLRRTRQGTMKMLDFSRNICANIGLTERLQTLVRCVTIHLILCGRKPVGD